MVMQSHGLAVPQMVAQDAREIDLRGFNGSSSGPDRVSPAFVAEIIHARVCEMISMIAGRITEHQLQHAVAGGVVLTGSGAMLGGIDLLFSKGLDAPARVGVVGEVYGLTDKLRNPDALGAVGMLDWMLDSGDAMRASNTNGARTLRQRTESTGSVFGSLASGVAGLAKVFSPNS